MILTRDIVVGDRKLSVERWASKFGIRNGFASAIIKAVEEPNETPYLLEKMRDDFRGMPPKAKKEIRNALLRVQIHCSIDSFSDPIMVSKQLFISQVLERLLFGCNLLLGEESIEEEAISRKMRKKKK